ncbi:MAG: nucleotidyltransferase family protein [Candidatus Micrarchaeota archaeon]|nr:nucleotidyltransferase family protein [Candidatus Micrarchaeota archaeon]
MKAVLVCGGLGTRLRPYTLSIPKPMLRVGNKPLLEYLISLLSYYGIKDIYLTIGYLKEHFKNYFGDGSKFGVSITYFEENESLNTAGSILPLKNNIDSTFLVMMGDHLTNLNIKKLIDFHKRNMSLGTLVLKKIEHKIDYGVVEFDQSLNIKKFLEKPVLTHYINTGIYVFEPEIFDYIGEKEDFALNVFPKVLQNNKKLKAYLLEEFWVDVGTTAEYEKINQIISIVEGLQPQKL